MNKRNEKIYESDDRPKGEEVSQKDAIDSLMKFKFEQLSIEKKIRDMDSINPLTMKIEDIIKLPEDLPVTLVNEDAETPDLMPAVNAKELAIAEQKDKIMENIRWILGGRMENKEVEYLI